jgi:very-short-patch-repair endonuclease
MKEITGKLQADALDELTPLAVSLAKEGMDSDQIASILHAQVQCKTKRLYEDERNKPKSVSQILVGVLDEERRKADSKIELILYRMLSESKIKFSFQYKIGPYTADYLVNGFLVIELDGPQHSKKRDDIRDFYMKKMGYKVIRVPVWVLASCPESVVETIKEVSKTKGVT